MLQKAAYEDLETALTNGATNGNVQNERPGTTASQKSRGGKQ